MPSRRGVPIGRRRAPREIQVHRQGPIGRRAREERRAERKAERRARHAEARAVRRAAQMDISESVRDARQSVGMEVDQQPPAVQTTAQGPSTAELIEIILQMQLQMQQMQLMQQQALEAQRV